MTGNTGRRILVVGAGAIGGYIGGSLSLSGHDVTLLCRPETAAAIRERGLELYLPDEVRMAAPGIIEGFSAGLSPADYDLTIFSVKRYDTAGAADVLLPYRDDLPPILNLQNGAGAEQDLQAILGPVEIIAGTVTTAVSRPSRNRIVVERFRGVGLAGTGPGLAAWVRLFNQAGLNAVQYTDAKSMKWSKLATNLIANPTSAILDMKAREIFSHPGLFRMEMLQLREALRVMRGLGARVVDLPGTPVRLLAFCASALPFRLARPLLGRALASGRGDKMPSFHRDLHSGAGRSEVGFLNGAVVRSGRALGIPTPVNERLLSTLEGLIAGDFSMDAYRHRPDALLAGL